MRSWPKTEENAASWRPAAYDQLVQYLRSDACAGVLLVGEIGSGKSMLVRALLGLQDITYATVRLICSAALTSTPYACLAPLLTGVKDELNDVSAIREALITVDGILATEESADKVLIIVEDGQYIDSASAFVLAQMVRAGSVKLLVLSHEIHQVSDSSEVLLSVAQLQRIHLDGMTVLDIQRYVGNLLESSISHVSAQIIHVETAGLHALVREYALMALRQDAFVLEGEVSVLHYLKLRCDQPAAEEVETLTQRCEASFRRLLELLILGGDMSFSALSRFELHQVPHQHPSVLIRAGSENVGIASNFYAEAVRMRFPPGKDQALFQQARFLLDTQQAAEPEFVRWALSHDQPISTGNLRSAARILIDNNQYALAELLQLQGPTMPHGTRQRIALQILLGLRRWHGAAVLATELAIDDPKLRDLGENAHALLNWLRGIPEETRKSLDDDFGRFASPGERLAASQEVESLSDRLAINQCQQSLNWYLNAKLDEASNEFSVADRKDLQFLLPRIEYRLSLLATQVRALVESAEYGRARKKIAEFELTNAYELASAGGTRALLHSLVEAKAGNIRAARELLRDAEAEVRLYDPLNLYPMAGIVQHLLADEVTQGTTSAMGNGTMRQPEPQAGNTGPRLEGATNVFGDDLANRVLEAQYTGTSRETRQMLDRIPEDHTMQRVFAIYRVWLYTSDVALKEHCRDQLTRIAVPISCTESRRSCRIVELCHTGDPDDMQQYAQELFALGDPVPALELMSQVAQFWSMNKNLRRRGVAIRQINDWLGEIKQEPWGIISRTMELVGLTSREQEIVDLVRQGLGNREISRLLTVSQRTVEGHLYRIFAKLGVSQRSELSNGNA